ncbi:Fatty acid desaturase [Rubellimicrobium thermophilum DSM 16684]|uniref:Fatty acid desaturase n=1 Tax=Rubellimicrobium thermophilum DSM 16684 TaxID=1123069 RepID=S9R0V8_9RHOB|nr:fatty acid desaturase [Rubellimicrobium thermophilum]EPX87291.1 Fatty acid desaturase [Rubellimicrobium thermophilum DSM 16684]
MKTGSDRIEWPTLALLAFCYLLWALAVFVLAPVALWLAVPLAAWSIAQHSSLCHEAIHGHPTRNPTVNAALVFPALALVIPYGRFRDTHLAHHRDANLTDPYDDPESNYLAQRDWDSLPAALRLLLRVNNTLAGRMLLGPVIGTVTWTAGDIRAMIRGDRAVIAAWIWHIPAVLLVLGLLRLSPMPFWAYGLAVYLALSLLKIRTFLEHQAHERVRGRTAIVEDRGPLALLFLNNNLHVVHHMHPRVPWYRLPALYRANPQRYLGVNGGYRYRSYGEIFRLYLWAAKDPVPHPILRRD